MGFVSVQNFCILHMEVQYMISKYNYIFIRCFCWHESRGEFTELWSGPDTRIQIFRRLHHLSLGREAMPFGLKNSSASSLCWLWSREQILLNYPQMSTDFSSFDFREVISISYYCKSRIRISWYCTCYSVVLLYLYYSIYRILMQYESQSCIDIGDGTGMHIAHKL